MTETPEPNGARRELRSEAWFSGLNMFTFAHCSSAAIAAASIVAKETRDELMCRPNEEHPGYGFASHEGYGTPEHAAAIRKMSCLSPVRRRSVRPKVYAEIGLTQAA